MATRKTKTEIRAEQATEKAREAAEFHAGLPVRILELAAKCDELGVNYRLKMGPELVVSHTDHKAAEYCEHTITMDSESWDVSSLEYDLEFIRQQREERSRRVERAQAILNGLTPEDQEILKKYILNTWG